MCRTCRPAASLGWRPPRPAGSRIRAGGNINRQRDRFHGRHPPRGVDRGRARSSGNTFEGCDRRTRQLSHRRSHRCLPDNREVVRVFERQCAKGLELLVGQQGVVNLQMRRRRAGVGDGDREGAAARRHIVKPGRQRRPAADAGTAGQRPQLDGADDAGAGMRVNATDLGPTLGRRMGQRVPAQHRRPAGDDRPGREPRPAALQPGRDRGVRVPLEPVRRDQGRSSGVQVNAITKSGTNVSAGSSRATSATTSSTRPISSPGASCRIRISRSAGPSAAPSCRDRLHFFANYEYEREPQTYTFNTPYPSFNVQLTGTRRRTWRGASRLSVIVAHPPDVARATYSTITTVRGAQTGQRSAVIRRRGKLQRGTVKELFATMTQVLTNRMVNEVSVGFNSHYYRTGNYTYSGPTTRRRQRHHVRPPAHHVPRLPDRRQRPNAAEQQRERLSASRRHHAVVQQGRAARHEARR